MSRLIGLALLSAAACSPQAKPESAHESPSQEPPSAPTEGQQTDGAPAPAAANARTMRSRECACHLELDEVDRPRSCETIADGHPADSRLWICDGAPIPFATFERAGCKGVGSGVFRSCCPPELTLEEVCPES